MRSILLLILSVLSVGLTSVPARAQSPAADPAPVLHPGDMVRIEVWGNPALSGEFPIAGDGTLIHPVYQEVAVAGVSLGEAEARVRSFLVTYEGNARFVFEPLFRVFVGGEVRKPDLLGLRPETTVAQAVVLAGGPTERANLRKVRIRRGGEEVVLDLTGPEAAQMRIRSGDQIYLGRRSNVLTEYIGPISGLTTVALSLLSFILR